MQGNAYILGFTDTLDPRIEPFVRKQTREERLMEGIPDFSDSALGIVGHALAELAEDDAEEELEAKVEALRTGKQRNEKGQYVPAKEG
jgi:hypothetical protein